MNKIVALLACTALAASSGIAVAQDTQAKWTLLPVAPLKKGASKIERGKWVFENACAVCHGVSPDHPGTMSLQAKYNGQVPAALEQRTDLTPDLVKFYVRNGIAMMAAFRRTELSDPDLDDLAAYLARKKK